MTRKPWTYRGIRIVPDGRLWDATTPAGYPFRAQSKVKIQEQIDAHLAAEAQRNAECFDTELAEIRLERSLPMAWGLWDNR